MWISLPEAFLPNPVSPGWSGGLIWPLTTIPLRSFLPRRPAWTPVNQETAVPLYVAVSTDTGCFQYGNTTADTHRVAAALMDTGIDVFPLNKRHFRTKTWARLQVERLIVERMHRYEDGKVAVAPVSLSLMDEAGATEEDMEDIAAFLGQIEGVETSVTIRELEDGACKLSVRTSGGLNATHVCALLGGGGHAAAAGCTVDGTLEQAESAILDAIRQVESNA